MNGYNSNMPEISNHFEENGQQDHLLDDDRKLVLFNTSKKEMFTPSTGFKLMHSRLKVHWTVRQQRDEITFDRLKMAALIIFGLPREKFSLAEFNALRSYISSGGCVLLLMSEGGEKECNINFLLEEFGILLNNDSVVRSVYHKFLHPKESYIANGILNRSIINAASSGSEDVSDYEMNRHSTVFQSIPFVYPYGGTLTVQKPAVAVLSSGATSYPLNRPICALCTAGQTGKLAVVGSAQMFSDSFIHKERNETIFNVIIQWLTTDELQLNQIDADDPEISDFHLQPDIGKASEKLRTCLQESDEVPADFTSLFHSQQYSLDTGLLPQVIKSYDKLHLKHEPLSLITPQFETPLPPLQPAVFPPSFHELPPPALDLFDLDESFSSERVRLSQLTNKCTEDDLEFYVRESGIILGISRELPEDYRTAKDIISYIVSHIMEYKKPAMDPPGLISPS